MRFKIDGIQYWQLRGTFHEAGGGRPAFIDPEFDTVLEEFGRARIVHVPSEVVEDMPSRTQPRTDDVVTALVTAQEDELYVASFDLDLDQ